MTVYVYVTDTGPLEDAARFAAYLAAVPAERRQRVETLRRPADRRRSLAAGVLLEKALAEAGVPGAETARDGGRLYLPGQPAVQVSLSHSGTRAMCALADAPVGCDVQQIRRIREGLAARKFTAEEQAALAGAEDRTAEFFRLWTRKESFAKASGTDLGPVLRGVSVAEDVPGWSFWSQGDGAYWYACCVQGGPLKLRMRQIRL